MFTYNNQYFSKIVAFGNSYSDSGEAYRISNNVMQNRLDNRDVYIKPGDELYWKNRYSNGYTSVEVMAKMFDVSLFNYAVGGATSGIKNYTSWMDTFEDTGVLGQINKYNDSLGENNADPDALYFIFPFENDYFKFVDCDLPGTIDDICKTAIENLIYGIELLILCGAKKFFIVSCSDLSLVPYEKIMQRANKAQEFTHKVNKKLQNIINLLIKKHSIKALLFNHTDLSAYIVNAPEKFGITKFEEACQSTYPKALHVKDKPNEFYFWDEWHFSRAIHAIFAKNMYHQAISYEW